MSTDNNSPVPENMKSRLKDSYDAIAPVYNEWTTRHSGSRLHYLQKLFDVLPLPAGSEDVSGGSPGLVSVLELGCGAGIPVTQTLLSHPSQSIRVTANDLSSTQIALGKERLGTKNVTWLEGDMMELAFSDATFDAVVGLYSLIHLPRDEQGVLIDRIARWLKPGGCVLLNFAAEASEASVMEHWLADKGWMFWSAWGAAVSIEKIKEAGLEVLINESVADEVDATFVWVIARLPES